MLNVRHCRTCRSTGRRSIAIANLECDDVVTVNNIRCFRIRTDKGMRPGTHKPHIVPIHPRLHGIVDRLVKDSQDGFLVPLSGNTPERRSDALQTLVDKSGEVTSHQFRTSVITMLHNSPEGILTNNQFNPLVDDPRDERHLTERRDQARGSKAFSKLRP